MDTEQLECSYTVDERINGYEQFGKKKCDVFKTWTYTNHVTQQFLCLGTCPRKMSAYIHQYDIEGCP